VPCSSRRVVVMMTLPDFELDLPPDKQDGPDREEGAAKKVQGQDRPQSSSQDHTSYHYDDGRVVTRLPGKRFVQSGNTKGAPTLYRLSKVKDAVAAGQVVYLVEGEKDVHAAEDAGLVATTAPMGGANFGKVDATPLHGARVVAVVDRDATGQKWAGLVAGKVGPVAESLAFREAAKGKDLADHLAAGLTVDGLVPVMNETRPEPQETPTPPAGDENPFRATEGLTRAEAEEKITEALDALRGAPTGAINDTLNETAFTLGKLVPAFLTTDQAEAQLQEAR
jgi:hypothetical protein